MDDDDDWVEETKKAINNAIWMNAPKRTTLEEAEAAAVAAMTVLAEAESGRLKA